MVHTGRVVGSPNGHERRYELVGKASNEASETVMVFMRLCAVGVASGLLFAGAHWPRGSLNRNGLKKWDSKLSLWGGGAVGWPIDENECFRGH